MREPDEYFRSCLSEPSGLLWFPGLAACLTTAASEGALANYSTSRFVAGIEPQKTFIVEALDPIPGPRLKIEVLPRVVATRFAVKGLEFQGCGEVDQLAVRKVLQESAALIGVSPSLASSVELLAKNVHILRQDDPAIDVSFSDPGIPFSIFVSVSAGSEMAAYRVAEAIIHESMHLQLTLIERAVALVDRETSNYYSPWKRSGRPVSGLLHALYVFGVIDQWLIILAEQKSGDQYALRRRKEIAVEMAQVDIVSIAARLTDAGKKFLAMTTHQR